MPVLPTLPSVVFSFAIPGGVQVERRELVSLVDDDGNQVRGTLTVLNVEPAALHVLSGKDKLELPEGIRSREVLQLFTTVPLRSGTGGTTEEADVVLYNPGGETTTKRYRVVTVQDFLLQSGHYRSFVVREEET